jgi:erythromycin esterase
MERIGDSRFVLLGAASHGTAEYYEWRATLSKRLIREKGFSFIAVVGDWPDCYRVNGYVKGMPCDGESARDVLHAFLYLDETRALHPLHMPVRHEGEVAETYPFGV